MELPAKSGPSPILAVTSAVIAPITQWESQLPPGAPPGSTVSSSAELTSVGSWRSAIPDPAPVTLPLAHLVALALRARSNAEFQNA